MKLRYLFHGLRGAARAKPRIRLSAQLTTGAGNFSVEFWPHPEDFTDDFLRLFDGARGSYGMRPSNEVMFIRATKHMRCSSEAGEWNNPTSAMICALRAAYEELVATLKMHFEVDVATAFDFELTPEKQVASWKLENTEILEESATTSPPKV